MNPSPFEIGKGISTNIGNAFTKQRDNSAIESILSDAMSSGDPKTIQNSIGKILSQVSPDRQGAAVQYLQSVYSGIQEKQNQSQKRQDEINAGVSPGVAPALQTQQWKDSAKDKRVGKYGLGGDVASSGQNDPSSAPPNVPKQIPGAIGVPHGSFLDRMNKGQLEIATGHPDREVSEPAKARLDTLKNEEKVGQGQKDAVFKKALDRSSKFIDETEALANTIPQKDTALNLMEDALASKNLSYFSPDNIAEVTGIEGFRSPEGAIFKTAGKEYFLGNIARAGARPNQWIEKQISDMMAKIGRSTAANLSVSRALRNELGLDKERVRLTREISDQLTNEGDLSQGKLGSMVNQKLAQYAEKTQIELFNDLRAIKAIDEKSPQKFRKVEKGTEISMVVAQALLKQFDNDPKKAAVEAEKLGYSFE